ncbi:hypothetical protein WR25_20572 isoform D [Diploscapter pachys]|nr:hypothetical protein WR25_20572 isoform D [Diploscapter pachys]
MGLKYPEKVKWLESPDKESIQAAIMELRALDAISLRKEGGYKLTEIGERLNKFPVAPSQARILLEAERLRCLEEALWIVSAMCVDSLFDSEERGKSEAVDRARKRFDSPEGDHISALLIMKACKSERKKGDKGLKVNEIIYLNISLRIFRKKRKFKRFQEFCARNFISFRSVMNAMKIRTQLKEIAKNNKMEILSCGADFKKLR